VAKKKSPVSEEDSHGVWRFDVALITGFVTKNLTDDFFYRSNAKEFYVLNAMVIGYGTRLKRRPR